VAKLQQFAQEATAPSARRRDTPSSSASQILAVLPTKDSRTAVEAKGRAKEKAKTKAKEKASRKAKVIIHLVCIAAGPTMRVPRVGIRPQLL
jgi:hypothetical protein